MLAQLALAVVVEADAVLDNRVVTRWTKEYIDGKIVQCLRGRSGFSSLVVPVVTSA